MQAQSFYVIVFESTQYAIATEKLFKEQKYQFDTIPTPREITSSCGLSIRFKADLLGYVKKIVDSGESGIKGIYEIQKNATEKIIRQIG